MEICGGSRPDHLVSELFIAKPHDLDVSGHDYISV